MTSYNPIKAAVILMLLMAHPHTCEQVVETQDKFSPDTQKNKGFSLFGGRLFADDKAEVDMLIEIAIGLTILLVVLGYVFAPVGLTAFSSVNRSAAGVDSGTTNGNIWDAIVPISLAALVLAIVLVIKKVSKA
jgi:hypothetical protein